MTREELEAFKAQLNELDGGGAPPPEATPAPQAVAEEAPPEATPAPQAVAEEAPVPSANPFGDTTEAPAAPQGNPFGDTTEAPAPEDRSFKENLDRQLSLTGRAIIGGAADLAGIVANPANALTNKVLGTNLTTDLGGFVDQKLTDIGEAVPETKTERIVQGVGKALVGGGAQIGAANKVAGAATGVTKKVAEALAVKAGAQTAAVAGASASSEVVKESGGGQAAQLTAALLGGLVGGGVASIKRGSKTVRRPDEGKAANTAITKIAEQIQNGKSVKENTTSIAKALQDGKRIDQVLLDMGESPDRAATLTNQAFKNAKDTLFTSSDETAQRIKGSQDAIVDANLTKVEGNIADAGKQTDKLLRKTSQATVKSIIRKTVNQDDSAITEPALRRGIVAMLKKNSSTLLRQKKMGGLKEGDIYINPKSGSVYMIPKKVKPKTDGSYVIKDLIKVDDRLDGTLLRRTSSDVKGQALSKTKEGGATPQDTGFELVDTSKALDARITGEGGVKGLSQQNLRYSEAKNVDELLGQSETLISKGNKATAKDVRTLTKALEASGLPEADQLSLVSTSIRNLSTAEKIPVLSPHLKKAIGALKGGDVEIKNMQRMVDELETLAKTGDAGAVAVMEGAAKSAALGAAKSVDIYTPMRSIPSNTIIAAGSAAKNVLTRATPKTIARQKKIAQAITSAKPKQIEDALKYVLRKNGKGTVMQRLYDRLGDVLTSGAAVGTGGEISRESLADFGVN